MSDFDDSELNRDEERRVAVAEYVLGVTSGPQRAAMQRAIAADPALGREARFWEAHYSTFNADYEPAVVSESVWSRIETRLFGDDRRSGTSWLESLALWRSLTAAAAAIAVVALTLNLVPLDIETRQPADTTQLVAALQPVESEVSILARYDAQTGQLRLSGAGPAAGEGSDYELWFIEGEDAPVSMGVFDLAEAQTIAVDAALASQLGQGITLAVTLETEGGSPTGAPQGPIVAAGPIAAI